MNTIDLILNMDASNHYYQLQCSDLSVLFRNDNNEFYLHNLKNITNLDRPVFFKHLKSDYQDLTLSKKIQVCDLLLKYNSMTSSETLEHLRLIARDDMIQHLGALDTRKYASIIALSMIPKIGLDLRYPVKGYVSEENKKNVLASHDFLQNNEGHHITFYNNDYQRVRFINNESMLYLLMSSIYHEAYHCHVKEDSLNRLCFQKDILNKMEYATYVQLLDEVGDNKKRLFPVFKPGEVCYQRNYYQNMEEYEAREYGRDMALKSIKDINPNFDVKEVHEMEHNINEINNQTLLSQWVSHNKKAMRIHQYYEQLLDDVIVKRPQDVQGILKKVYLANGTRKSFPDLVKDEQDWIRNHEYLKKDIHRFYLDLYYRSILRMTPNEYDMIIQNEEYKNIILEAYLEQKKDIKKIVDDISTIKTHSLSDTSNKLRYSMCLMNELKSIQKSYRTLYNENKEKSNIVTK